MKPDNRNPQSSRRGGAATKEARQRALAFDSDRALLGLRAILEQLYAEEVGR